MRITGTRMSTKKPGKANPITLGILFMLVGGLTFFLFALPPLEYANASKNWPFVPGEVTSSEIDTWRKDGKTQYQAKIVYHYSVDEKTTHRRKLQLATYHLPITFHLQNGFRLSIPLENKSMCFTIPKYTPQQRQNPAFKKTTFYWPE